MKPNTLKIILGSFQILSKNRGDIHKSSCNTLATGVNDTDGSVNQQTPMSNFSTQIAGVSDTGGNVKDTSKKFCRRVNVTGGKLPLVSMTPAAN
jgi:hypothetical protein